VETGLNCYAPLNSRAILYVMHGTFAHFRKEPQILGYNLETELNVFS